VQRLIEGGTTNPNGAVGPNAATATSVVAEPRSNSLIVRAANLARMAQARLIIDKLDQPASAGGGPAGNIWVVYLKNADATRLADVLRAAMSPNGGAGSSSSSSSSTGGTAGGASYGGAGGAGGATSINSPTSTGTSTGGAGGAASPQTTTPVSAAARPSTGGQIQADPATNSLIITAPEPQYRQMRAVIDQLDVRRAQVYVETLMVSVDAQRMADFGFQWQGLFSAGQSFIGGGTNFTPSAGPNAGNPGDNLLNLSLGAAGALQGSTTTTTTATTGASLTLPSNGLNIGFVPKINGVYTLAALAHFLEQNSGANVLSTPNLVALDNEEAKIVVGQNIPLVTGSYTNTGTSTAGTVNPFQTVERQDVGITLRIKSSIGENGTVRMTIYEENSSVSASNSQVTNKTSVETFVTVDDGAMIVLGGLMKDEYGDGESGVPVLSSIPIIGNLFKSEGRSRHKSNLMLFLRPIVLRDQADSDRLTVNRYDAIREQQQSLTPTESHVMRVNDSPVIPRVNPDTRVDPNAPPNTEPGSVPMLTPQPATPLRPSPSTPPARVFLPPAVQPPPEPTPTPPANPPANAPAGASPGAASAPGQPQ
jgi:general secretion pathway protein D